MNEMSDYGRNSAALQISTGSRKRPLSRSGSPSDSMTCSDYGDYTNRGSKDLKK